MIQVCAPNTIFYWSMLKIKVHQLWIHATESTNATKNFNYQPSAKSPPEPSFIFPQQFSWRVRDLALRQKHLGAESPKCFLFDSHIRTTFSSSLTRAGPHYCVGCRIWMLFTLPRFPQLLPHTPPPLQNVFPLFHTAQIKANNRSVQASRIYIYSGPILTKSFREF